MLFYNLLLIPLFIILLPYLMYRFNRKELRQRMGFIRLQLKKSIWIHAASVGEVNAVKPLVLKLLGIFPDRRIVVTTMTATGQNAASEIDRRIQTFFLPFDCFLMMKRFFTKLSPQLIILVETEFWPNMLWRAKINKVPILVVNGRISDKSFPGYKRLIFFWKPLWKAVKAVNAQSEINALRFKKLGFMNVVVTKNLKFCLQLPIYQRNKLRNEFNFKEDDFIIVWGSSRPGEERLFYSVLQQLKEKIANLKIIIVPRHLKRLAEIESIFTVENYCLFSAPKKDAQILIVDKMGVLTKMYALADLAIVGGSFFEFGGHNPLEAAFYGIPILMGKYHNSCRDSVSELQKNKAIIISDEKKLVTDIFDLYKNKKKRREMGENAAKTLQENSDSLEKNLEVIERFIE